jgi:isoleucyl-tRNA synthetase
MRRVEDVLDVWFDSGSMSFAQVHYPFENAEWFEHHFPGDFIVEYIGQTRGWFYTLHVLATALFDRPAFKSVVSHGIVLGSDGQKMSKSLRNYPDVTEVFNRDGADAMRWFLMNSGILRGSNLVVTEEGIREGVRQVLIPLWNSWYFFSLYANAMNDGQGYAATWSTDSTDPLDRYLLAKLRQLVERTTAQLDLYDIPGACERVRQFVDVLTNWYIRRSRERFWDTGAVRVQTDAESVSGGSAEAAFDTLYTALEVLTRIAAPLLPLVTEEIWRGLTGGRSVHLTDWPLASDLPGDDALVAAMDRARTICSVGSSLRKAEHLRVRLPLAGLTVVTADPASLEQFAPIIADELNVKSVTLLDVEAAHESDFGISQKLTVNARAAGPRLGKDVQLAIKGSKSGDWSVAEDGTVTSGGLALVEGEYTLETVVSEETGGQHATAVLPGGGFVVLDTDVTQELELEGIARDLIRAIQQARRESGFEVTDRITTVVAGGEHVWRAALDHRDLIMNETLTEQFSTSMNLDDLTVGDEVTEVEVGNGQRARILVRKR